MCVIIYGIEPFVEKPVCSLKEFLEYTLEILELYKNYIRTTIFGKISDPCQRAVASNVHFIQVTSRLLGARKDYAVLDLMSLRPTWYRLMLEAVEKKKTKSNKEEIKEEIQARKNGLIYAEPILYDFTIPLIQSFCLDLLLFLKDYRKGRGAREEFKTGMKLGIPCQIFDGSMLEAA